ncbi:hypothetical protein CL657_00950 [bacterium]|nr:hypothetical protein [bacterium]
MFKRSCPIFICDKKTIPNNGYCINSSDVCLLIENGRFFSVFPKCFSYDLFFDDLILDGVINLIQFLHKEGCQIRLWNDFSVSEDTVFKLRLYINYWGFYFPTFNSQEYQDLLGDHTFKDALACFDRLLGEGINAFLHLPLQPYHMDDLPEWVDFILEHHYLTLFHYQKSVFTARQIKSLHYFEQFLPVFMLPLVKPYYDLGWDLPLHSESNFEATLAKARFRKGLKKYRSLLKI